MGWPQRRRPCDCDLRAVLVTVTIKDAAGNVRAVRDTQYFVRPHRHHGWFRDDLNH